MISLISSLGVSTLVILSGEMDKIDAAPIAESRKPRLPHDRTLILPRAAICITLGKVS